MTVHIIGAGLGGLSAAVELARRGIAIRLYEAAPRAGGRCRSFHDALLDCVIDNGNHLILSGNHAVMNYLDEIGARDRLVGPAAAAFPFIDVENGLRWNLRPNRGPIPWWLLDAKRRVPGTPLASYLSTLRLLRANASETVAECIPPASALYRRFWEPLTVAALNIAPEQGAAALMQPVLRETFLKGAAACRPLVARESLAHTLVEPALAYLATHGADVRFGCRVKALTFVEKRIRNLTFDEGTIEVLPEDAVILAVPSWIAETLVPGLSVPPPGEAIVNVHYRLTRTVAEPGDVRIIGLIGGLAQWVFARGGLASVTISAADAVAESDGVSIAARCWSDVTKALDLGAMPEPQARVIKEKRATFSQTPAALARRPSTRTQFGNLLLAGDWTATGLPATIEGAIRSGVKAAAAVIQDRETNTQKSKAA